MDFKSFSLKIPVFCEKPATLSLDDMKQITDLSKEKNVLFLEAFKMKFNHGFNQLKEDLLLIGDINRVNTSFCFNGLGNKDSDSYLFKLGEGGALNDVGTYVIGFILDVVDAPIKTIKSNLKIVDEVDEHFEGVIHFENGAEGYFEGAIDRRFPRLAIIKGANGAVIVPNYDRIEEYEVILNNGKNIKRNIPIIGTDMVLEIQEFINLVESSQNESKIHSLKDTELIIRTLEQIRVGK